ncbi:hypothetical protein P3X46_025798 [Hevea brasiliensis]|uniref:Cation/H+ exchanger domain-containing protein n=1 Tax=Hevea brasiliensis TaxID=3981 RepID=A0ABQ9L8J0_HEVBR|nr:cation/H(+) antiporter 15-like [Hevea brasiliensis]KAJ9160393.1 hypothetical protein P3X46_025798 [Hevea brasiliensis]
MYPQYGKPIIVVDGNFTTIYPTVCFTPENKKLTHSIFYKQNPLDFVFPVLMLQIISAFFLSRLIYFVLRPLRQPKMVCNILAGIILGPSVLGRNEAFLETFFPENEMLIFNIISRLGTAYLIFLISVKTNTDMLLKSTRKIWTLGVSSYLAPLLVSVIFSLLMRQQFNNCVNESKMLFVSASLSVTYFPVVAQFIEELDLLTTEFGLLTLSSSMLIQMMSISTFIIGVTATRETYIMSFAYFLGVCGTVVVAVFIIRPVVQEIINRTPEGKSIHEFFVIAILIGTLIMAFVTDYLWMDFLLGAFLMGLIIPDGPPLGSILVEKSELMINEFFLPIFFVHIGYQTDVHSLKNIHSITAIALLVFVIFMSKMMGTLLASIYLNIRFQDAIFLALILNFKGVMDWVSFQRFLVLNILGKQCFTVLVLFNLVFIAAFYPVVDIFYNPRSRLAGPYSKTKCTRALQSTPQEAELRAITCIYEEDNVPGMLALLEAVNQKAAISPLCAYVIHVIELVGRTTPILMPYKGDDKDLGHNSSSSSSSRIMHAFINYSNNTLGHVTIQPFSMVAPFKTMHNFVCNLAEDRHVPFIIVPFHENQIPTDFVVQQTLIQDFNVQLQEHAPCTVGILLDRGLRCQIKLLDSFTCKVAVFFVGGVDDREALALAIRMSANPNVNITLLRIKYSTNDHKGIKITESQLDDLLVNEFVEKNVNNSRVVIREEVVNNSLQMLNVIHSLRNKHDFVMVGKKSGATQFEQEMMEWVKYPELGAIGDLLASTDFYDKKMSVLVLQHCKSVR